MKLIRLVLFCSIIISLLFSCAKEKKDKSFRVNGTLKNLPDNTLVILLTAKSEIIDSARVKNESIVFKGKIENPTNVYLLTPGSREFKTFWLENNIIDFVAEKGDFINADISGSKTQDEHDILAKKLEPILKKKSDLMVRSDVAKTDFARDSIKKIMRIAEDKELDIYKEYIKGNPNSLISISNLNIYKFFLKKAEVKFFFSSMNDESKNTEDGKSIARYLALYKKPQIGDKYIDFEQKNPKGEKVKISDVMGDKYTLIQFWASWCAPCRKENPELVRAYNNYKDRGFEIVGVSLDHSKDAWINAIKQDNLSWQHLSDLKAREGVAAITYGVGETPDNILIDAEGVIVGRKLLGEDLKNKLKEILVLAEQRDQIYHMD